MVSFSGVTEIVMFNLRVNIELDQAPGFKSAAGQLFLRLKDTIGSRPGFLRQYWGYQVEDPHVLVGVIEWKSFEEATAFRKPEADKASVLEFGQTFDLAKTIPLQMYTRFNTDPTVAFQSGTTEIALYTLPIEDYTEETRKAIDESLDVSSMEAIKQFGAGGATGWVFETHNDEEPEGHTIALLGVYGYPTVDHHRRWRASSEHTQVMKELEAGGPQDIDMRSATVPGGGLFVPGEGIFHVQFHAGE